MTTTRSKKDKKRATAFVVGVAIAIWALVGCATAGTTQHTLKAKPLTTVSASSNSSTASHTRTVHHITFVVAGASCTGMYSEGERHMHNLTHCPFSITKKMRPYGSYGFVVSLNGLNPSGNITGQILIDGKVVAQKKTGFDKDNIAVYIYRDPCTGKYSTDPLVAGNLC